MKYKNMYSIGYKKPNDNTTYSGWYGGNNPEEAITNALTAGVKFHNQYSPNKLDLHDLTIVECKLSGDYASVMADLQRG